MLSLVQPPLNGADHFLSPNISQNCFHLAPHDCGGSQVDAVVGLIFGNDSRPVERAIDLEIKKLTVVSETKLVVTLPAWPGSTWLLFNTCFSG